MSAKQVLPSVYATATMIPNMGAIYSYLNDIGVPDWLFQEEKYNRVSDPEMLIEFAGRVCYQAFGTTLNPNITRVREDPNAYIKNIISSGHGSVLEHVHIQFTLHNVSRVLTHELVRHRHGNFSQESMRYVRLEDIEYVMPFSFGTLLPPSFQNASEEDKQRFWITMQDWFGSKMAMLATWQKELAAMWEISEIKDFHTKKLLTSDFRRLAPHGVATDIVWTTNLRELRHTIEARTNVGAEAEIRHVFGMIADHCWIHFPKAFADMEVVIPADDPIQLRQFTFAAHKI